jgi:hypothetical protein
MALRSGSSRSKIVCKSGSEWTNTDLEFFRIKILQVKDFAQFFNGDITVIANSDVKEFLSLDLSNVIIQHTFDWTSLKSRYVRTLVKDIIAVTKTHRSEESAVDDMARSIFQVFEYDAGENAIRTRETIVLEMCNSKTQANPDVCIESIDMSIRLLVQEDKSYNVGNDRYLTSYPEAQLIAEAIAAFQENIRTFQRLGKYDISPNKAIIPGIVMLGTCPTFYKIHVTNLLAECVRQGEEPNADTLVERYVIPNLPVNMSDALLSQEHARHIVMCYEAFRKFVIE